ncbi:hypothetical protein OG897_18730 [Streptomyces sp. NBC_00237]|nr:hypothetical protein [Streptomyces sp. NBC_00237]MCX5203475.1 hypothetical protein [Streptomyces sp. NBC_00237]
MRAQEGLVVASEIVGGVGLHATSQDRAGILTAAATVVRAFRGKR